MPGSNSVFFNDFLDHQSSRADVEAKRDQARSAGAKGGKAKAAKASGPVSAPLSETVATATHLFSEPLSGSVAEEEVEEEVEERTTKRRAPAKPGAAPKVPSPEQTATAAAHERVGKALNFIAVRGVAKWAIHERGVDPSAVEDAIVAIYEMGKPVTKQVMGQFLDGFIGRQQTAGGVTKQDAKVLGYLERGQRLADAARQNTQKEIS
jgi:hypothetical protein